MDAAREADSNRPAGTVRYEFPAEVAALVIGLLPQDSEDLGVAVDVTPDVAAILEHGQAAELRALGVVAQQHGDLEGIALACRAVGTLQCRAGTKARERAIRRATQACWPPPLR